jgi:hypothetical protein
MFRCWQINAGKADTAKPLILTEPYQYQLVKERN